MQKAASYIMDKLADYHIHSTYNDHSDPDLTINNVIQFAECNGLKKIAFTEHVRKTSDWIPKYLDEIQTCAKTSSLEIISGFEAKILQDGEIDCPSEYRSKYFVIASFHSVFGNKQVWINALKSVIRDSTVDVIGHLAPEPGMNFNKSEISSIAEEISQNGKVVELNSKYCRPPLDWITAFRAKGVRFHLGSDAHSLRSIGSFDNISDLIAAADEP
ncbi:MAG TPA: PHP domain-containing protein [Nitrososphaeraceae archaeon]